MPKRSNPPVTTTGAGQPTPVYPLPRQRGRPRREPPDAPPIDPRSLAIREALAPYLDFAALREAVRHGHSLRSALISAEAPPEVTELLRVLGGALLGPPDRIIRKPDDAALPLLVEMGHLPQEELWVLLLNRKNRLLETIPVYRQTVTSAAVRPAEVFRRALQLNAPAIIVAHNHPSGDPTPSPDDITITHTLIQAGKLLSIDMLDHLIIGHGRYVSLRLHGSGLEW